MKIGIICEYNPFHNGHKKQIDTLKEKHPEAKIYCFMSGDFCQRGIPAITHKYCRAEAALKYGVDAVIEIPQLWAIQAGDYFANASVKMFKDFGMTHISFGSETNHLETIRDFTFTATKEESLAASLDGLTSNDRLGYLYLRELDAIKYKVKPILIQRNDVHDLSVTSGKGIRNLAFKGQDFSVHTDLLLNNINHMSRYYAMIRQILLTRDSKEFEDILLVSEGIQNLLIKNARAHEDFNEFIKASTSKKYTSSRIHRTLLFILLNIKETPAQDKYRLLGFSESIAKEFKDKTYTGHPIDYEQKVMDLYSLGLGDPQSYLKIVKAGRPIIKKG